MFSWLKLNFKKSMEAIYGKEEILNSEGYREILAESRTQMEAYIRKKFKLENEEELEN